MKLKKHVLGDRNFELKQSEKITRRLCRDMPNGARNNFPEFLVLGPEQLKVIQEIKHHDRCVFLGEAGCGKTFILIYLLYQNTSKHLRENECKKVVFVIPKGKTEIKAFVEKFVEDFCNPKYVYIESLFALLHFFNFINGSELILIDEFYPSDYTLKFFHARAKVVIALGLLDGNPFPSVLSSISSEWTIFNLRSSYRNQSNISSLCRKLRQLADGDRVFKQRIQLNIALDSSLKVNDEDSNQIKHIDCCSEIGKEINERKEETLLVADDKNAFQSEFMNEYTNRVHANLSDGYFFVQFLSFTGVQYKNVVILLMTSTSDDRSILTLLYHSISRSTHRVILLTPDPESYKTLLTATPEDLKVFEKLRRYQNVPKEDLLLLTNEKEYCNALLLTILTESWSILDYLIETLSSRPDASILRKATIRILLKAFPLFEIGEILNIMSKNFSDEFDTYQMLKTTLNRAKLYIGLQTFQVEDVCSSWS